MGRNRKWSGNVKGTNTYTCKELLLFFFASSVNKGYLPSCIYMIDPGSLVSVEARRALTALPGKSRSQTTISKNSPPDLVSDNSSVDDSDDEDDDNGKLTMSPAEIRVIRRLSARVNVLPVISRADSLTDEKLLAMKNAGEFFFVFIRENENSQWPFLVRTGLAEAGINFGVFGPNKLAETPKRLSLVSTVNGDTSSIGHEPSMAGVEEVDSEEEENEDRKTRPVIKLRSTRRGRNPSRSRSRRDLSEAASADIRRAISPDADSESIANVRFSAHIVGKTDLTALMPFALIAPEPNKRRQRSELVSEIPERTSSNGHDTISDTPSSRHYSFLQGRPEALKGVFIRKFRWGTVDVLDPIHCDFSALRTAVFSTHLKVSNRSIILNFIVDAVRLALENPYKRGFVRKIPN